ncbi:nicotinate-nucleotide adenylyltransferase [Spirochaeta thermophila DSM 6578]|uniref:Probable nicotinate-nucleotide adenylyltransferase n=1 Tax=Winmispira thermophila (strain ATCC 700085 / DSM 6578 / Z-1203) TaxID=869211 RepID=G0GDI0_WINT7|nr:nicotinate (nicotinamide) nucleotide adenylyltransferase [Spirochaeta thermophila]AEJ61327.1 nicotinate-nucleotide adenylyltransferase [Spirochaeta thermophila DSM 6578]
MRVLLFGGTFNPIHVGHLFVAEEACVELGYEKVIFVPAYRPAHKVLADHDDPMHRYEMVERATAGNPRFTVDDCEIRRQGTSYTLDTITYLMETLPLTGKLGLLIGDDLVPGFSSWKHADILPELVDIVIARRTSSSPYEVPWRHTYITNTIIHISSSEIRERVAQGKAFRYLVPEPVYEYIVEHGLYRS